MKKHHYTYMLSANKNQPDEIYYIGVRSSNCPPEDDKDYMGSSKLVSYMRTMGISFEKEIIKTYGSRLIAEQSEQEIFDLSNCISFVNCVNLNSFNDPYTVGRASEKMDYYKKLYPQIVPGYFIDKFRKINRLDLKFKVQEFNSGWQFINHPEHLKFYYPTTGTMTYWPGREDKLMGIKQGTKRYYLTDVDKVDGTPFEQIKELMLDHYVDGQRYCILESVIEHMKLIRDDLWEEAYDLICEKSHSDSNAAYLVNGLTYQREQQIKQQQALKKKEEATQLRLSLYGPDIIYPPFLTGEKRVCPHCGKEGTGNSMLGHHFNKCKQRKKLL